MFSISCTCIAIQSTNALNFTLYKIKLLFRRDCLRWTEGPRVRGVLGRPSGRRGDLQEVPSDRGGGPGQTRPD